MDLTNQFLSLDLLNPYGLGNLSVLSLFQDSKVILDTATITTCIPGVPYPTGHPVPAHDGYTTVYTTECIQVCPTETPCPKGTKTATYTITETCTGDRDDYTPPALPPHFTTAVTVCDACEGKPTLTITLPGPEVTGGNNGYVKPGDSQGTGGKGAGVPGNSGSDTSPPNTTHGADNPKNNGYVQSSIATTGRDEVAAMLLGCVVGLAAWLL